MMGLFDQFRRDHAACGDAVQFLGRANQKRRRVAGVLQRVADKAAEGDIGNGRNFNKHGFIPFN